MEDTMFELSEAKRAEMMRSLRDLRLELDALVEASDNRSAIILKLEADAVGLEVRINHAVDKSLELAAKVDDRDRQIRELNDLLKERGRTIDDLQGELDNAKLGM
jgi:predicted RNase H-like nuclease (RuvC/YqgF family)